MSNTLLHFSSSDQPSISTDSEQNSVSSQDNTSPAPTPSSVPTPSPGNVHLMLATSSAATTTSPVTLAVSHIASTVSGSSNPFSICKTSSILSSALPATRSSTSSERERRASHQKGSNSLLGEHSTKSGKMTRRGKVTNPKLKVLSFSDIENGLPSFSQSASSWADTLGEVSWDRLLRLV